MASNDYNETDLISDSDSESVDISVDIDMKSNVGSDISTKRLTREQYIKMMKLRDPDYYTIVRRTKKKNVTVEMYSTRCNPGVFIRDPKFGTRTKDRVGTLAEHSYFKVRMTTVGDGVEPVTLFYDSPDAYEIHQKNKLSHEIKQSWRSKFASIM